MLHRMPSACCVPTSLPDWWTSPVVRVIDVGAVGIGTGTDPAVDRHARYALNGCVLPVGERVRGYVQLSDTDTMNRVWGDRWGGTVDGLFVLQDVVTAGTVRAVEFELVVGEPARIYRSVLDGAVLGVVYRGLCQLLAGPRLGWRTAVELFSSVAASHPDEVVGVALGAFSRWWGCDAGLSHVPDADLARAGACAARGRAVSTATSVTGRRRSRRASAPSD